MDSQEASGSPLSTPFEVIHKNKGDKCKKKHIPARLLHLSILIFMIDVIKTKFINS
jgi:hypothetical protein